ncbi:MAG: hypothetical protein COB20_06730 [SAR86 cluster bacterium]|uniref:Cytochrome c domain-containing protein n=1 Tax=SAR86 cluster bacterium TaxID=2030880 RepID=A0A2A4X877_9GAMM|nr:MAG: hypothetical protein COB20_06730 [SAR86 cluster bacterium]
MIRQNRISRVTAVLAILLLSLAQMNSATAQPPPKDPNNYVPGLGDLMGSLQVQHGKLWFADSQQNWPLAAYAVDAIREGIADMIVLRPRYKGESIVEMLSLLTAKPLQDLEEAVEEKDDASFMQAYDSLTEGCNVCHRNHDYGFIAIQRPTLPAWTNLRYRP